MDHLLRSTIGLELIHDEHRLFEHRITINFTLILYNNINKIYAFNYSDNNLYNDPFLIVYLFLIS